MSEEEAFLRAICENPDEDTPRLVFADWLDERGGEIETKWASLLREQLRPGSERLVVHLAYDEHWMDTWGERFEFPATLSFDKWARGLPVCLGAPATDLLAEWDRVFHLVPVTELHIWQAADDKVEDLVASCDLRNLRELLVRSKFFPENESILTDRAMIALAECPALRELSRLIVQGIGLTDLGVDAALRSPYLMNLREFHVSGNRDFAVSAGASERFRARFGRMTAD